MKSQTIVIAANGSINFIYNDNLSCLSNLGEAQTKRASHVEPEPDGSWSADMLPVGGPKLTGFKLRQEALDAEVSWLNQNIFQKSKK